MLKVIIIAIGLAIFGFVPLMGLPGALVLYLSQPIINLVYGPLAFEAWERTLGSSEWAIALVLTLLWPVVIPVAYLIVNSYLPEVALFSLKKLSLFLILTLVGTTLVSLTYVFLIGDFKQLNQNDLYREALYANQLKMIEKLDRDGLEIKDLDFGDPLFIAIRNSQFDIAKYLIAKRENLNTYIANPDNFPQQSGSPLHDVIAIGSIELLKLLLDRGADPNKQNAEGETPAFMLSWISSTDAQELLLLKEKGADFTIKDYEGNTIITALVQKLNSWDTLPVFINFLIKAGVDPLAKNNLEKSALDYAVENHHTNVIDLLEAR